jgi:hypothetical protein
MASVGAKRTETRLTVRDVLETASSEGLRMTTEKAENYLIEHCISLWHHMKVCGREYVLEHLKTAFREQSQNGGVRPRKHDNQQQRYRMRKDTALLISKVLMMVCLLWSTSRWPGVFDNLAKWG